MTLKVITSDSDAINAYVVQATRDRPDINDSFVKLLDSHYERAVRYYGHNYCAHKSLCEPISIDKPGTSGPVWGNVIVLTYGPLNTHPSDPEQILHYYFLQLNRETKQAQDLFEMVPT